MGPPPPPPSSSGPPGALDTTFMEKLHAVEEELALSSVHPETYQVGRKFPATKDAWRHDQLWSIHVLRNDAPVL